MSRFIHFCMVVVLCLGMGCAESSRSRSGTEPAAYASRPSCASAASRIDRDPPATLPCPSPSLGWGRLGDAISGAAAAVRPSRP